MPTDNQNLPEIASGKAYVKDMRPNAPQILGRVADFVIGPLDDPYLLRWWFIPRNKYFNIYIHHILKDDDDRALHDHPWFNCSIVVKGVLQETMPSRKRILRRFIPYLRKPTAAHSLQVKSPVWTIFITGPRVREWGFLCPKGWRHWRKFVGENPGEVGRGCGE